MVKLNFCLSVDADKIQVGRPERRRRWRRDDVNTEFDERDLAELVRQNMRANNVYVPAGYR